MKILRISGFMAMAIAFCFMNGTKAEAKTPPLRVLCLGDSLTEGFGVKPTEAWPDLLAKEFQTIFPELKVINAGISGSTSASGVSRLKWALKKKETEPVSIMILALGANDALRGLSPESLEINLQATIALAKQEGITVILAGMKAPPNLGSEYSRKYEDVFVRLKNASRIPFIPFLLEGVAGQKNLNIADGIHPNAKGHEVIASNVKSILGPQINLYYKTKR